MDYSWVVVGAGVVGCAVAEALTQRRGPGLIVEQWPAPARETTSRNSGVVHAGLHHPGDWLKTTACIEGRRRLYALCASRGIPHRKCGKLVVAQDEEEEQQLRTMRARAESSGVKGITIVGADALTALEPRVRGRSALVCPESGIVDPHALTDSFLAGAREGGSDAIFSSELREAELISGGFRLVIVEDGDEARRVACTTEAVVNCCGLDADRVAALFGIDVAEAGYEQTWAKGDYWRLAPRLQRTIGRLVYPVPPAGLAGLGIHLTVDLDGGLRLGPGVEWLPDRTRDFAVREEARATFLRAAERYLEGLESKDLAPDMAGIRPKLSGPGGPPRDFVVRHEADRGLPGLVNLVGIESPGLTAAPALASMVADLLS